MSAVTEIADHYALTSQIDPAFAARERAWFEARTADELRVVIADAWECNDPGRHKLAGLYLSQMGGT